jgi:acyl carrier protein
MDDSVHTVKSWDSLRHLNLILALEEKFGVTFEAEEIPELVSVRVIAKALESRNVP